MFKIDIRPEFAVYPLSKHQITSILQEKKTIDEQISKKLKEVHEICKKYDRDKYRLYLTRVQQKISLLQEKSKEYDQMIRLNKQIQQKQDKNKKNNMEHKKDMINYYKQMMQEKKERIQSEKRQNYDFQREQLQNVRWSEIQKSTPKVNRKNDSFNFQAAYFSNSSEQLTNQRTYGSQIIQSPSHSDKKAKLSAFKNKSQIQIHESLKKSVNPEHSKAKIKYKLPPIHLKDLTFDIQPRSVESLKTQKSQKSSKMRRISPTLAQSPGNPLFLFHNY